MPLHYHKPHIPDFRRVTRALASIAVATVDAEVEAFAEREAADFTRNLERQTFASFRRYPLKRAYFKRKKQQGLDERVMIATEWYKDHVRVWRWRPVNADRHTHGYRVGFHPRVQARDAKGRIVPILLDKLAKVHEHGSADQNIPPRPHWRPHLKAMTRRARTLRERIRREILKALTKKLPRYA